MKRIGNSKEPNIQQMLNMASNLRERFRRPASIKMEAWHFNIPDYESNVARYGIYIAHLIYGDYKTWPGALAAYRNLMKEEVTTE